MRGHDGDARRQEHGLLDAVRDEDDGEALRRPEREQLAVETLARELVERAERLSIRSKSGLVTSARAIDARICMPPDNSRGK